MPSNGGGVCGESNLSDTTGGYLISFVAMSETTPIRGYSASKEQLQKRLARIEGQVRGIAKMVDDDRYCIDILTQISAIQAALDKVALGLLDGHAHTCVIGADADQQNERTEEMMAAVGRLLRRG
jgi:DNA-binding FrmR family transcriptional regulator